MTSVEPRCTCGEPISPRYAPHGVCQNCYGTDDVGHGAATAGLLRSLANNTPLLAVAAQNHLMAQHDYMGQDLGFLVDPWAETLRTIADALTAADDWHDSTGPFGARIAPPTDAADGSTP